MFRFESHLTFPKAQTLKIKRLKMPCFIEEKIDGWRMMLWCGHAYGRKQDSLGRWINKWNNLPDHVQALAQNFPVDGELYWPGYKASDVSTGLKERSDELRFIGFRVANANCFPHKHLEILRSWHFPVPQKLSNIFHDSHPYCQISDINPEKLLQEAKNLEIEGWVLKEKYTIPSWWKLKLVETYDLIVTGFTWALAGRNFQKGWIKSLVCSAYVNGKLQEIANVSGMTDAIRSKISKKDISRVVEVQANLLASQGRLKHPRFIRWRDDKNAAECKF